MSDHIQLYLKDNLHLNVIFWKVGLLDVVLAYSNTLKNPIISQI